MPRRKRFDKRKSALTPGQWAFLNDADARPAETSIMEWLALRRDVSPLFKVKDLWAMHRDAVIAKWIVENPGERPTLFWKYSAPEPRRDSESQASYLERNGLMIAGERKRLTKRDFEAEQIDS
jgi:hypothetical protein